MIKTKRYNPRFVKFEDEDGEEFAFILPHRGKIGYFTSLERPLRKIEFNLLDLNVKYYQDLLWMHKNDG